MPRTIGTMSWMTIEDYGSIGHIMMDMLAAVWENEVAYIDAEADGDGDQAVIRHLFAQQLVFELKEGDQARVQPDAYSLTKAGKRLMNLHFRGDLKKPEATLELNIQGFMNEHPNFHDLNFSDHVASYCIGGFMDA